MCVFLQKMCFSFLYSFLLYGSLLQKNMSLYIARKTYREKCICFLAKMEEILKKLFLPFVFNAFFRFALLAKQPTHICLAFILRVYTQENHSNLWWSGRRIQCEISLSKNMKINLFRNIQ